MSAPYVSVSASYTFSTEDDSPPEHSWSEKTGYSQGTKNRIKNQLFTLPSCRAVLCSHGMHSSLTGLVMWRVAVVDITDGDTLSH